MSFSFYDEGPLPRVLSYPGNWQDKVDKESRGHMRIRDKEIRWGGNTPRQKNDRNNGTLTCKQGRDHSFTDKRSTTLAESVVFFGKSCSHCVCSTYQFGQDCLCLSWRTLVFDKIWYIQKGNLRTAGQFCSPECMLHNLGRNVLSRFEVYVATWKDFKPQSLGFQESMQAPGTTAGNSENQGRIVAIL